ncbi:hypothetical protein Thiowin_05013 [Thiorhodovibrio winogradskyi]|uniref:IstB-like ATP-binding protein domain-containing protein n=1 Tax=Thiorhodovibrio winogradskyi TaxID=77007 RepID=A0ABZ0SFQ9_9GAMM|nr:hypothetical protein [Thiorhodovibrio winogradskyi]
MFLLAPESPEPWSFWDLFSINGHLMLADYLRHSSVLTVSARDCTDAETARAFLMTPHQSSGPGNRRRASPVATSWPG